MLRQPPSNKQTEVEAKAKKSAPAVDFTEAELDTLLSQDAIDQEIKKMRAKGVLPSQRIEMKVITADVTEAVRWQENKEAELKEMQTGDTEGKNPWIQDLSEDFVAFGLSPANTKEEAKILLTNMDKQLSDQSEGGFGPEARDYISTLRKELELLIEKL